MSRNMQPPGIARPSEEDNPLGLVDKIAAAKMLGFSVRKLDMEIKAGKLRRVKFDRLVKLRLVDLAEYVERQAGYGVDDGQGPQDGGPSR